LIFREFSFLGPQEMCGEQEGENAFSFQGLLGIKDSSHPDNHAAQITETLKFNPFTVFNTVVVTIALGKGNQTICSRVNSSTTETHPQ